MHRTKLFAAGFAILMLQSTVSTSAQGEKKVAQPANKGRTTIYVPKDECDVSGNKKLADRSKKLRLQIEAVDYENNRELTAKTLTELVCREGTHVIQPGSTVTGTCQLNGEGAIYSFRTLRFTDKGGSTYEADLDALFDLKEGSVPVQRDKSIIFVKHDMGETNEHRAMMYPYQILRNFKLSKGDIFTVHLAEESDLIVNSKQDTTHSK